MESKAHGTATHPWPPVDRSRIDLAAEWLRRGEAVAFPTETFYGLGAPALDPGAVARLAALKGRPSGKPLPCIVGDLAQVALLCDGWPDLARKLADRFWPGPVTLVVPARKDLPVELCPEGFVGLRLSSHPWARALALAIGGPLTSTSANPAGEVEATRPDALAPKLVARLGFVLDGGPTPGGLGSTVVRVDGERLSCLREGAVPFASVQGALGR